MAVWDRRIIMYCSAIVENLSTFTHHVHNLERKRTLESQFKNCFRRHIVASVFLTVSAFFF